MIKSMTGYGKGEYENELYKFKVEIKSVNHRYSDISIKMPRHIIYLEDILKKTIKNFINRGKVDVYINLEYVNDSSLEINIDIPLAKSYKVALENLTKELSIDDKIRLNNIIAIPDIIKAERKEIDEKLIQDSLIKATNFALEGLMNMRVSEGKELKEDMLIKLSNIDNYLYLIEDRSPTVINEYKDRLRDNILEILNNHSVLNEDRLNNEVAYFIDKSGIDEEVVRLKSHIKQFRKILKENEPVGRKLDFLIQEFNREINTIGSKSSDEKIAGYVVELKFELEKIREQVQNIE